MHCKTLAMTILLMFAVGFNLELASVEQTKGQNKYKDTVIGINLGTTYSYVGVYRNGNVEIIANAQGNRITLSWVAFTNTERLIEEAVKFQALANPTHTVFDAKRLLGRKFDDETVQKEMNMLPFKVVEKNGKPYMEVKDGEVKVINPEEISAKVLTKVKEIAEAYLGQKVKYAVLTVPHN